MIAHYINFKRQIKPFFTERWLPDSQKIVDAFSFPMPASLTLPSSPLFPLSHLPYRSYKPSPPLLLRLQRYSSYRQTLASSLLPPPSFLGR